MKKLLRFIREKRAAYYERKMKKYHDDFVAAETLPGFDHYYLCMWSYCKYVEYKKKYEAMMEKLGY